MNFVRKPGFIPSIDIDGFMDSERIQSWNPDCKDGFPALEITHLRSSADPGTTAMNTRMLDTGWLWDARHDSDVRMVISTRHLSPSESSVSAMLPTSASSPELRRTGGIEHRLHSVILASASEYFKTCLTTEIGWSKNVGSRKLSSDTFKYEIVEQVDESQLQAAGAVLQMMYKQALPSGMCSVKQLLDMLQV